MLKKIVAFVVSFFALQTLFVVIGWRGMTDVWYAAGGIQFTARIIVGVAGGLWLAHWFTNK